MIDLSILIPVYNGGGYASQCLQSIKNHPRIRIEIITVDDGSSDHSYDILLDLKKEEKRLQVFKYEGNRGIGYARNYLLNKAKGKYVYFIDIDDEIVFDHVIKAYETAVAERLDVFVGECQKIGWGEKEDHKKVENLQYADKVLTGPEFFTYASKGTFKGVGLWRNIYRREFLIEHQLFFAEGIVHGDNEYFPKVHQQAKRVLYQNFILYKYYKRENSIVTSTSNYLLKIKSRVYIVNSLLEQVALMDKKDARYKGYCNFIAYNILRMYRYDTKNLQKEEVKAYYKKVPKKAYLYTIHSQSKVGKLTGLLLYMNTTIGQKAIRLIDGIKGE